MAGQPNRGTERDQYQHEPRDIPNNPPQHQRPWYTEEQIEYATARSPSYQELRGVDADTAAGYLHAIAEDPVSFGKAAWVAKVVELYGWDRSTVYTALRERPEDIYVAINEMLQRINSLKGLDGAAALAEAASKIRQKLAEGLDPAQLRNTELKILNSAKDLTMAAPPTRVACRTLPDGSVEAMAEGSGQSDEELSQQAQRAVQAVVQPVTSSASARRASGRDGGGEGSKLADGPNPTTKRARDPNSGQDTQAVDADEPEKPSSEPSDDNDNPADSPL